MAGQKRGRPGQASGGGGGGGSKPGGGGGGGGASGSSATVYRKSAKKQRTDEQQQRQSPAKKPVPQRTRPKDDPKPKTKHQFIQAKKAAAQKEKLALAADRRAEQHAIEKARKQLNGKGKTRVGGGSGTGDQPAAAILIKSPTPTSSFHIVAGSYERLLYGLEASVVASTSSSSSSLPSSSSSSSSAAAAAAERAFEVTLKPIFTFPAHISSIRTVATAGADSKWLATGGTDEIVKVWDLRKRREVGQLTGHEGTITSLVFASRTYLLTSSADANINLYRTRDWALLRTLKGHIGRINSVSPHPTGRLALSVGSDRTIRMWDLMRGQSAASTRIGVEADLVKWDTLGQRFAVLAYRQAMIFSTDMTKVAELEDRKRIGDVAFFRVKDAEGREHELLLAGLEDGIVKIFDLDAHIAAAAAASSSSPPPSATTKKAKSEQNAADADDGSDEHDDSEEEEEEEEEEEQLDPLAEVGRLEGHQNRVRCVSVLPVTLPSSSAVAYVATTVSSDGQIRVFDLTPIVARLSSASGSGSGS
ncbi:WD40 repeat-like protein, partial [Testicularia cyperi]